MTRTLLVAALVAALPAVALAQTPPAGSTRTAEDLTRDLNSGPPAAAAPVQRPAPVSPAPASAAPTSPTPTTSPAVNRAIIPAAATAQTPQPTSATAPAATPAPVPVAETDAAEPAAPRPVPLDAAARARLPFAVTLPAGTEIVETPSGPGFDTWAVRRGDTTLVRLYAGPASQFPVYDGEIRSLNGRSTVVVTEGTARRALEHLFEREGMTPREIHVMVSTLSGGDQALAEAIGQSVDPR